jgi:transcriptional regulator with XRE-family HTH domain
MLEIRILSGVRLRNLREGSGLSQSQLAYLTGMSQQAISLYERSQVTNYWVISKIAQTLGVDVQTLLEKP